MRNPVNARNKTLVVFLIALAVFIPALVVPRSGESHSARVLLLVFSLAATLFSGIALIVFWDTARRFTRLRSGQGVLATWTLDAARWEWFRQRSAEWDRREGVRANEVDFAQHPGDKGIEVVVTRDGILVGTQFRPLERNVKITVYADWVEFYQIIPNPKGSPTHDVLRLALEPGKEQLATHVQQAYQTTNASGGVSRRAVIYVGLFCVVGVPMIAGLVWLVARATGWVE